MQDVASRTLDRCAASSSAWTAHTVTEHATRIMTEYGVPCYPYRDTRLHHGRNRGWRWRTASRSSHPDAPRLEHVAHLTSVRVMQAERNCATSSPPAYPTIEPAVPDVRQLVQAAGLDAGQTAAAVALASTDPLVIVEGAAGSGKTTMLATAITAAEREGCSVRVVAPTKKAADVARRDTSASRRTRVAALVHAHGYRWNTDGVWTRLAPGDLDPETGRTYIGPPETARLREGERIVVDEAGMLDQESALALFTVAAEAGAILALVGDRAQLPAVGRGGVLDMAAQIRGRTVNMNEVHRFTDAAYAHLSVRLRDRDDPGAIFDQLNVLGLIRLHADTEHLHEYIATK